MSTPHTKKAWIILVGFAFVVSGSSICWAADDYPKKSIEIIIPYAAGGSADLHARVIAEKMKEYLKQPIVIVNKTGGATAVGTSYVANSKPDGYTLLITTSGIVHRPIFDPSIPYRYTQFRPVGISARYYNLATINKDLPIKNLSELVDYAKKNPGTLSYSVSGIGSNYQIVMEYLKFKKQMTDVQLQCIPYDGDLPAMQALLGNHVQLSVTSMATAKAYIEEKRIRGLAVLASKRDPLLPEVSTSTEQGFPYMDITGQYVWVVPLKTPDTIVKKLEDTLEKALQDKQVQEKSKKIDLPVGFITSQETKEWMDNAAKFWTQVIKEANLTTK